MARRLNRYSASCSPGFKRPISPHAMGQQENIIRVRIGPFRAKEDAQQIASALKRGGHHVFLDEVPENAIPKEAPPAATPHAR